MWLTPQKWLFNVPAAEFKRRGGVDPGGMEGLPVGFFRWWFLDPFDGRLLVAWEKGGKRTFLLRKGDGTIRLEESKEGKREHVTATRREGASTEAIEWTGRALLPHAGDRAKYVQDATGLRVEIVIESVSSDEPDPAAFSDPEDMGVVL
jgi:hypothetical protein